MEEAKEAAPRALALGKPFHFGQFSLPEDRQDKPRACSRGPFLATCKPLIMGWHGLARDGPASPCSTTLAYSGRRQISSVPTMGVPSYWGSRLPVSVAVPSSGLQVSGSSMN